MGSLRAVCYGYGVKRFKKIYIEISNICNLQCSFCPEVERGKKLMSAQNFAHILKKVAPFTEQITLHLMGEPLAHPEFEKILEICDEENHQGEAVKINLTTNAVLIKRKQEVLLKCKSLHQINFSVHSFKDNFPQKEIAPYLESLIDFSKALKLVQPETYVNFRLWNLRDDLAHKEINQMIIHELNQAFSSEISDKIDVAFKKSKKLTEKIYLNFDSQFRWPDPKDPVRSCTGTCYGLETQLAIHADGTVVPCCLDKEARLELGNLLEQDLVDILQSPRAQKMRFGFSEGNLVEDLCQKCTFIKRFDRKAQSLKTGDSIDLRSP